MIQHNNHLQPEGDPYNLGQWIETVPHAYDPTLQPEIGLTGELSKGLLELAAKYTGQELPVAVNDNLSRCIYSAAETYSKLQRTQGKIENDDSFDGKERPKSYILDEEDLDFDSLSDEQKSQLAEEIDYLLRYGRRLALAHEIALARIRMEQDMIRRRQESEPKEAIKIARSLLHGVNAVCRLFNDQLSPTKSKAGDPVMAIMPKVIDELSEEWGTDIFR